MSCFILFLHHLNGDIRAITFTLIASNTSRLLGDFVSHKGENLDRTDLYTNDAAFAIDLIPDNIQPRLHVF